MARLEDYDYELPTYLIAQEPLDDRSASRLLVLHKRSGAIEHRHFRDCLDYLEPGDLMVMNDTRVTARRLHGVKQSGGSAKVEALLLREHEPRQWEALVKPGKRLPVGAQIDFQGLVAEVESVFPDGRRMLRFHGDPSSTGQVPLPPYIHRALVNEERYQTVYARQGGSAAAPTAGLHLTPSLLESIVQKGVDVATITLDVGLDTFRPVQTDKIEDHPMHGERCAVSVEIADKVRATRGKIVAVGTTTVRTLESMATGPRQVEPGERTTTLFIRPGYTFQVVDAMFTNFHMPRTTMLMMLSAMAGRDNVLRAYAEAIARGYRFLSFGDSMLIV